MSLPRRPSVVLPPTVLLLPGGCRLAVDADGGYVLEGAGVTARGTLAVGAG